MAPRNNPDGDGIAFRDWVKDQIAHEREMREHETRVAGEALKLQATEYSRRLEDLNHEHRRVAAMQNEFMSKSAFDIYVSSKAEAESRLREQDAVWRREINRQLDEARGAGNRTMVILGVGLTLLSLGLRFIQI